MAHSAAGDGSIELARGRRAPYTQVGDWVALADVSRGAKALYWLLAAHVNPQRDDGGVWPSRRALAEALGYTKVESVDPLVKELTKLGAVDVERRRHANGAPAPNRYVVHGTPPAGYAGPASLAEFYDRRRRQTAPSGVAPSTGVPLYTGGGVAGSTGGGVPPYTGHELDQEELDQEEPPPPAPSAPLAGHGAGASAVVDDATEEPNPGVALVEPDTDRAGGHTADQRAPAPAVDSDAIAVVVGASWPPGRRPGAVERERLAREVRPCLDRGHQPVVVQQAMTSNLDGARNLVAVAVTRLRELATADAATTEPAVAAAQVEPHPYAEGTHPGRCGRCGRVDGATAGGRPIHPRPRIGHRVRPRPTPGGVPAVPHRGHPTFGAAAPALAGRTGCRRRRSGPGWDRRVGRRAGCHGPGGRPARACRREAQASRCSWR